MIEPIDTKQHESFGLIKFDRIYGNMRETPLFGAEVTSNNYIELTIRKNAVVEDSKLGRRYCPTYNKGDEVVRIAMTESQFASLISNFNRGEGTPCTITDLGGIPVKAPAVEEQPMNLVNRHRRIIEEELKSSKNEIAKLRKDMEELVTGKPLSKTRKEELLAQVRHLEMLFSSNVPFHVQQAGECVNRIADRAKDELMAIVAMHQLGTTDSTTFGKLIEE